MRNKQTLVAMLMAALNLGDEGKLGRFANKVDKKLNSEEKTRKEEIERNLELIEDKREQMNDYVKGVKVENVNSTDGSESFTVTYLKEVRDFVLAIKALEERNATLQAEIDLWNEVGDIIFPEPVQPGTEA